LVRKIFLPVAENKKGKKVLILAHEKYWQFLEYRKVVINKFKIIENQMINWEMFVLYQTEQRLIALIGKD
jgi:hypothetical protein